MVSRRSFLQTSCANQQRPQQPSCDIRQQVAQRTLAPPEPTEARLQQSTTTRRTRLADSIAAKKAPIVDVCNCDPKTTSTKTATNITTSTAGKRKNGPAKIAQYAKSVARRVTADSGASVKSIEELSSSSPCSSDDERRPKTKLAKCCDAPNQGSLIATAKTTAATTNDAKHLANGANEESPLGPSVPALDCEQSPPRPRQMLMQMRKLISLGERNGTSAGICNKHMPWFGIDVGGSLVKVVFFDPKEATPEELVTLKRIRQHLKSPKPYGKTGKRDAHLEMPNCLINKRLGSLHFIRFATSQMPNFLAMAKCKRFADTISSVCATGGGAYKFENVIKRDLGITLHQTDELDSIIYGIHYIDKYNSDRECYYIENPLSDSERVKAPYDFSRPYPYLVVNIGSGVSILAVYSSTSYSRISGSSLGGGTFFGLCCMLTQCKTFDEAIRLAKAGCSTKVDKLVKDIYGGDYPKFNLSGDTVASSFGHMNIEEKRKTAGREDIARALLEMVTINIGSIARMCAANENIDRVVFIGNFLRVNELSMNLLSYAVNYWSKGAMKALFLEHEGYFGAVGCFVESTQGCLQ